MVADTGATPLPGGIRPLDPPRLVRVHLDDNGVPKVVQLKPALSSSNGPVLSSHPLVRSQRKIKTDRATTSGSTSSPRTDATPVRPELVKGPALSSSNGPVLSSYPLVRSQRKIKTDRTTTSGSTSSPRTGVASVRPELVEGPAQGLRRGSSKGQWRQVLEVLDTWRIDDEWWRKQPVSRLYYRVVLEDGTMTGLFKDLTGSQWYQQRA